MGPKHNRDATDILIQWQIGGKTVYITFCIKYKVL